MNWQILHRLGEIVLWVTILVWLIWCLWVVVIVAEDMMRGWLRARQVLHEAEEFQRGRGRR